MKLVGGKPPSPRLRRPRRQAVSAEIESPVPVMVGKRELKPGRHKITL